MRNLSSEGLDNFFFLSYLPSSSVLDKKIDTILSTMCAVEETGRAHPPLISLAQILVVNGKR